MRLDKKTGIHMPDKNEIQVTCRLAKDLDLDFIYRSLKKLAEDDGYLDHFFLTQKEVEKALFSRDAFAECLVGEVNHNPIAIFLYSILHLNFNRHHKPVLYVHDLYVHKAHRRLGVANVMREKLIQIAKENDCDRIDGIIPKANIGATAFYNTIDDIKVLDYIHYMRLNL